MCLHRRPQAPRHETLLRARVAALAALGHPPRCLSRELGCRAGTSHEGAEDTRCVLWGGRAEVQRIRGLLRAFMLHRCKIPQLYPQSLRDLGQGNEPL